MAETETSLQDTQEWLAVFLRHGWVSYRGTPHNLPERVGEAFTRFDTHRVATPWFPDNNPPRTREAVVDFEDLPIRVFCGMLEDDFLPASGQAVEKLLTTTNTPTSRLVVVVDNPAAGLGWVRQSFAPHHPRGHPGLDSVVGVLGGERFWLVSVGTGYEGVAGEEWAWSVKEFDRQVRKEVGVAVSKAVAALDRFFTTGRFLT